MGNQKALTSFEQDKIAAYILEKKAFNLYQKKLGDQELQQQILLKKVINTTSHYDMVAQNCFHQEKKGHCKNGKK